MAGSSLQGVLTRLLAAHRCSRCHNWQSARCADTALGLHVVVVTVTFGRLQGLLIGPCAAQADTGTKMLHIGKNTRSRIISKGISAGNSRNCYRGLVQVCSRRLLWHAMLKPRPGILGKAVVAPALACYQEPNVGILGKIM